MQNIYDKLNQAEIKKFDKINDIRNIYDEMDRYFSNGVRKTEFESEDEYLKRKPPIYAGKGLVVDIDDSVNTYRTYNYDADNQLLYIIVPNGGVYNGIGIKSYESQPRPILYSLCSGIGYLIPQGKGDSNQSSRVFVVPMERSIAKNIASLLRIRIAFILQYPAVIGSNPPTKLSIYNPKVNNISEREYDVKFIPVIIHYVEIYNPKDSRIVMRFVKKPGYKVG